MIAREKNKAIARQMIVSEYWKDEYKDLFSDLYYFDFPTAPPGMPQRFQDGEVDNFFEWMGRTVKRWDVDLEEIHGVENDSTTFFAVGWVDADVYWGMQDGHLHSKMLAKISVKNQKVCYMKLHMDPLKFLDAAGRKYPIFRMDIDHPEVYQYLENTKEDPHAKAGDAPEEELTKEQKIQKTLDAFRSPDYWYQVSHEASYQDGFTAYVWCLPPEMDKDATYDGEELARVEAWSVLSCPEIDFHEGGITWKADDADIYFGEYDCKGTTTWLGNDVVGKYRNNYFYILRMNEKGEVAVSEEFLNPINKMNSINVSVPSFPYYL